MHAWQAIQKTLDYIENHIGEEMQIEELAEIAGISLFYYQRLFTRLVKTSVRDYIKLRRLAKSTDSLKDRTNRIIDIAIEYGFGSHETYTRAFKETYKLTPSQYREKPVNLQNFDKPDLLLSYLVVEEGVPLISDGVVLEMSRKFFEEPISFLGVIGYYPFKYGNMFGERTGIDTVSEIWNRFYKESSDISRNSDSRLIGISFHGDAPDGYSSYFVGLEVTEDHNNCGLVEWILPAREYVVCGFETENHNQMMISMGKAMRYTRFWLRNHGLVADGFFPEMYYQSNSNINYVELWIPFKKRESEKK